MGVRRVRDSCGMNVAGKARAYWSLPYNMPMNLIDIGLNLSHDSFDRDREAVWQRAVAAG